MSNVWAFLVAHQTSVATAVTSYSANLTETDVADGISLNLPLTGAGIVQTYFTAPCAWCF